MTDLQHPIGGNPFLVTKDEVCLRISIDGLVRFCSPIDSLQVPKTWSGPCNNFTVSWDSLAMIFGWSDARILKMELGCKPFVWLIREQHNRETREDDTCDSVNFTLMWM